MATVPHVTSGLGLRKFQADGFLLTRVYFSYYMVSHPRRPYSLYSPSWEHHVWLSIRFSLFWSSKCSASNSRGSNWQVSAAVMTVTLFVTGRVFDSFACWNVRTPRIGSCGDRPGRIFSPASWLYTSLCPQHADGRRRVLQCRRPRKGDVYSAVHQRIEQVNMQQVTVTEWELLCSKWHLKRGKLMR